MIRTLGRAASAASARPQASSRTASAAGSLRVIMPLFLSRPCARRARRRPAAVGPRQRLQGETQLLRPAAQPPLLAPAYLLGAGLLLLPAVRLYASRVRCRRR